MSLLPEINAAAPTDAIARMRDFLGDPETGERLALAVHLKEALTEIIRLRARTGEGFAGDYRRITLCGSSRFRAAFAHWHARLMLDERAMVFTAPQLEEYGALTPSEKDAIDLVWFAQIEASDAIFVLDVGGYVGQSTAEEIAFAQERGITVRRLSAEFPDWSMEASCG